MELRNGLRELIAFASDWRLAILPSKLFNNMLTIETEIEAKRNNMISELIIFRITKAKANVKFGVKYLCGHACERSSVQSISIRKRKQKHIFGELIFTFNVRVKGRRWFEFEGKSTTFQIE